MRVPEIPSVYLGDFVRGYFDGDGHVRIEKVKGIQQSTVIIKRLRVVFTSGSREFLEELSARLNTDFAINLVKVFSGNRSWGLAYSTNDSMILFKEMYKNVDQNLYLERKFNVFTEYFNAKPGRIDQEIYRILR